MKKQIIVVHGGDSFKTHDDYLSYLKNFQIDFERLRHRGWKETLSEKLGKGFEVIQPKMPNSMNSRYSEWKIWFDKLIPFFEKEVILIGHSLGGIFLVKYLADNNFAKKILATFLVSAPFDDKNTKDYLADFGLPKNLDRFEKQSEKIYLYHSLDDNIVPFADFEKYVNALPGAQIKIFKNRGHFQQEVFPELIEDILSVSKPSPAALWE